MFTEEWINVKVPKFARTLWDIWVFGGYLGQNCCFYHTFDAETTIFKVLYEAKIKKQHILTV